MTNPPLRRAEHCIGKVEEAPASPPEKSNSSPMVVDFWVGVAVKRKENGAVEKREIRRNWLGLCIAAIDFLH
jgi:hypothetical protein